MFISGALFACTVRVEPFEDCKKVFARQNILDADAYFVLSDEFVQPIVEARAEPRARMAMPGAILTYCDTLSELEKVHMDGYCELRRKMIHAGKLTEADAFVADASQNPLGCCKICSKALMTQTRTSHPVSVAKKRGLTGVEGLAALGVPTPALLQQLHCADLSSIGGVPALQHWSDMKEVALKQFAGNGMHLHCIGVVIAWFLSTVVPASVNKISRAPGSQILFPEVRNTVELEQVQEIQKQVQGHKRGPSCDFGVGCRYLKKQKTMQQQQQPEPAGPL